MLQEHALIEKLKKKLKSGIGDDAAVISYKGKLVLTVDALVENQHFKLTTSTLDQIGQKAMAVNLSDIAAMGALPLYALVSLGLPKSFTEKKFWELYYGVAKMAKKYKTKIIGGNISKSERLFIDITLIGKTEKPVTRSGAKAGDLVIVTGPLGIAASKNYLRVPTPRIRFGQMLSKMGATSLIDISDGLSSELHHVAKESKVGFEIWEEKLIKNKGVSIDNIWNGGEDYELLATIPPSKAENCPFPVIGKVVPKSKGIYKISEGKKVPVLAKGFDHFS